MTKSLMAAVLKWHRSRCEKYSIFIVISSPQAEIDRARYYHGTTDTASALLTVKEQVFVPENGDRPEAPNVVLLLSDGESDDPDETFNRANELRDDGAVIVTVGKFAF